MSELLDYLVKNDDSFANYARLTSLYSDFSNLKTSNADGYAANVSAWRIALEKCAFAGVAPGGRLSVRVGRDLEAQLESRRLGRPMALPDVIHDSLTKKTMIPLTHFLNSKSSPLSTSWLTSVHIPSLADIARWGLQQVGLSKADTSALEGDFVLLANVKDLARKALALVSDAPTSNVFTLPQFTSHVASVVSDNTPEINGDTSKKEGASISETDIGILLKYLTRDLNAATTVTRVSPTNPREMVTIVKLAKPGSKASEVSDTNVSVATLSALYASLSEQISTMTTRVKLLETSAKQYARDASKSPAAKSQALSTLRMKNMISSSLVKRIDALSTVESTLLKLEEAASNAEIVAALDVSANVMMNINKRIGGVERVDQVLDRVRDASEGVDEVARALGEETSATIDEGEIEDELQALQEPSHKESTSERDSAGQERIAVPDLPAVPEREPSTQPVQEHGSNTAEKSYDKESKELEERLGTLSIAEKSQ